MSNEPEPAVDTRSQTPAAELMHYQTAISVPVVERPVSVTVVREEWVPEGMPAELSQQVRISPLYYAEHVGRVGVLAAALGVGAAIAGTAGVASAAPAKADSTTSSPSTTSVTKGSSAAENTAKANSSNAGPTKASTTETHSRTDRHTSNRETHSRSETTETESAGVGTDENAADQDTTTETTAPSTTPAADTPSESVELPSAPSRHLAARSTATDATTESTTDLSTAAESAPLISTVPQAPAPVGAAGRVQETVLAPLTVPASQAGPTVQAAQAPLLSKIFPWLRSTKTPTATTTPAQVVVASSTAAVASSTATAVPTATDIKLPASATVFTLRGRDVPDMPDEMDKQFGGVFNAAPYTEIDLDYPVWSLDAIEAGVKILDASLMSTSGNIIVEGHSEGAEIISRWMRTYANDPTRAAMASRVTFILTGNPLRAGGGKVIGLKEPDGVIGVATPTTTPYSVIDVARRYDRWADMPNTTNAWTLANSNSPMNSFHTDYTSVNMNDSTNTVWRVGNTTYVLTRESVLPLLVLVSPFAPADYVAAVRAKVEAGYTRVSGDTSSSANLPSVPKIKSKTWQAKFDKLVLQYGA